MTWTADVESVASNRGLRHLLKEDDEALSFDHVLHLLEHDEPFIAFFNGVLAESPFGAFRWETPPVTATTIDRPCEFVLLDSPALNGPRDPSAFADQFARAGDESVITFANLGGDARLIVPQAIGPASAYGHLAAFVRQAPSEQRTALWRSVARSVRQRLSERPLWLSTAGMGVPWLHVRLDDRPKYYGHQPYRSVG